MMRILLGQEACQSSKDPRGWLEMSSRVSIQASGGNSESKRPRFMTNSMGVLQQYCTRGRKIVLVITYYCDDVRKVYAVRSAHPYHTPGPFETTRAQAVKVGPICHRVPVFVSPVPVQIVLVSG